MSRAQDDIGKTQEFVIAKGFTQIGQYIALIGADNTKRVFIEIFADRDRNDVRPMEAYMMMLLTIHPGWSLRILQVYWPDEEPRKRFMENVVSWRASNEAMSFLKDSLVFTVQSTPIPFGRRTFIEMVVSEDECLSFWDTLPTLLRQYGVEAAYSTQDEIENLSFWVFNATITTGTLDESEDMASV